MSPNSFNTSMDPFKNAAPWQSLTRWSETWTSWHLPPNHKNYLFILRTWGMRWRRQLHFYTYICMIFLGFTRDTVRHLVVKFSGFPSIWKGLSHQFEFGFKLLKGPNLQKNLRWFFNFSVVSLSFNLNKQKHIALGEPEGYGRISGQTRRKMCLKAPGDLRVWRLFGKCMKSIEDLYSVVDALCKVAE